MNPTMQNEEVKASDGAYLRMDVYLPENSGSEQASFPVAVERTPYGKSSERFQDLADCFTAHGIAFVVQDVRGRGESDGDFRLIFNDPDEGEDGADTLAWVLEQPWCNGKIATVGGSFSAVNQQSAALHRPKGLVAQILRDSGTNYYERMLRCHGVFNVGVALPWILDQAITSNEVVESPEATKALNDMKNNSANWSEMLPLERGRSPLKHSPTYEALYFKMMETENDDEFWQTPTARLEGHWDKYPTDLAILQVSGWFAHHLSASLDKHKEFTTRGMAATRLIIGPWIHSRQMGDRRFEGDCDFGEDTLAFAPYSNLWLNWLKTHLKEEPKDNLDDIHYFVMGTGDGHKTSDGRIFHGGKWKSADAWPIPGTKFDQLYFHKNGCLSFDQPSLEHSSSTYRFDPNNPNLGRGGVNLQSELYPDFVLPGPRLQTDVEEGVKNSHVSNISTQPTSDVLQFDTDVLKEDLEITGPISAKLYVSTSAKDADFVIKLLDIYPASEDFPTGCNLLISDGVQRLRFRGRSSVSQDTQPGEVYEIEVELGPTSNLFKAGHKIRIEVCSSNFPHYDCNPGTGEIMTSNTTGDVAHQTLYHAPETPSFVLLPTQRSGDTKPEVEE